MRLHSIKGFKIFGPLFFILTAGMIFSSNFGFAQVKEEEINYVNHGPISSSKEYEITGNSQFIVFTIQNNAGKSIHNIYPWIYKNYIDPNDGKKKYMLINNVHRGGVRVSGVPHWPGTRVDWRFSIIRGNEPASPAAIDYVLLVHPNSIHFSIIETPRPVEKN